MKHKDIYILSELFPDFFNNRDVPEDWDEDDLLIDNDDLSNPEGDLYEELNPREDDSFDTSLENIDINEIQHIFSEPVFDLDNENNDSQFNDIFGGKYPGSPSTNPSITRKLGFYLPWHIFSPKIWGIYLIHDAIESAVQSFHINSKKFLSKNNCRKLLREFIFQHEKYHNVVETFASRLEITHRIPFYNNQVTKLYNNPANGLIHEEALANSYAYINTIELKTFKKIENNNIFLTKKRAIAKILLKNWIKSSPTPYNLAANMLYQNGQKITERDFQEHILRSSTLTNSLIWKFGTHMMQPSLKRNGHFIYIISKKSHIYSKNKLSLGFIKYRDLYKKLKPYGIKETFGRGKHHRKFELTNGLKIPVPSHGKDIAKGTATRIIKECGINISLEKLMESKFAK
jgi:hypothetical protein